MSWLGSFLVLLCLSEIKTVYSLGGITGGRSSMTFSQLNELSNLEKILGAVNKYANAHNNENQRMTHEGIFCATQQVVAGMNYEFYYIGNCGNNACTPKTCVASVWVRVWLPPPNNLIVNSVNCGSEDLDLSFCPEMSAMGKEKKNNRNRRDVEMTSSIPESNKQQGSVLIMEKQQQKQEYQYDPEVKTWFNQFIKTYGKTYSEAQDSNTYRMRYEIFQKNLQVVEIFNKMDTGTAIYGITKFMDLSEEEFKKYFAPGLTQSVVDTREADLSNLDLSAIPDSVDWREKGAVTVVKNQGMCGSCWAFSTTGNVEGQWFLKHKKLISLSEQELVDCDTLDQGCGGGLPSNAYKSIEKLGGLETEKDYPYEGTGEKCHIDKSELKVYINDSVAYPKDEVKLAAALAKNGPISIGINANMMQFYFGGISHPWKIFCNPSKLDHGVLIVGYGTENGTPYWIIKNSWGPSWGEKGYYRIYRGDGSCGVNQMATSAIVD